MVDETNKMPALGETESKWCFPGWGCGELSFKGHSFGFES